MNLDFLKNKWMNDANVLAQIGHVLGGYGIVLTAAFLGGRVYAVSFAAALMVYAAVKEFWYDARFELPKQTWQDNVLDFSMYGVGTILGLVTTFAKLGFSLAAWGVTP